MNVPAVVGVTSCVPESATVPLQASLAWQAVAFELDQVSVVDWPTVSAVGLAPILTMTGDRLTVGIGVEASAATTDALLATPLQVRV